jgi:hypothetical protein
VVEEHTVADLNPRAQAVKSLEMTVVRCLQLIEVWDKLPKGGDWADTEMSDYRRILGNGHYAQRAAIVEMFRRYKDGTLHREVLDLAANLPPSVLERKEIRLGVDRIKSGSDSRSKRKPASADAGGRRRSRSKRGVG